MQDNIRQVSQLAFGVISNAFEAHEFAEKWLASQDTDAAESFVKSLYGIEAAGNSLSKAMSSACGNDETITVGELFASVNSTPVQGGKLWSSTSAHEAIQDCGMEVGAVAFAVVRAGLPGHYKPGVEYQHPPLLAMDDMLRHIDVAIDSFLEKLPSLQQLNDLSVMREQELARALMQVPPSPPPPRLVVSVDPPHVTWDGEPHPLSADAALVLDVLVKADGDWVTGPKLTKEVHVKRPDRIVKALPKALDGLVEANNPAGFRIVRSHME